MSSVSSPNTLHFQQSLDSPYQKSIRKQTPPNKAALDFFTCAIIWFDILSCVSTNSVPHLASHHDHFFSSSEVTSSNLELHNVMGCQNWVMKIISEIAHIGSWRHNQHPDVAHHIRKTAELAKDIQTRLQTGISTVRAELEDLRHQYLGTPPFYFPGIYGRYTTLVVTNTFACAALIYLQTSVTSSPSVFHIQDPLQDVISAMRLIPDPRMVRGMVWPLCVAGCLSSSPSDQELFRSTAKAAIKDAGTFGNSCKALEILETAWKFQEEEGRLIDCTTCIQRLGICVLLA
jgi:hypothetical protein